MLELFKRIRIAYKVHLLGMAETAFPIDIFSLSRAIADLRSKESAYKLIDQFKHHDSFYVRRATLVAIRFMGPGVISRYQGHLLASLKDEEGWVKYDAAWALGESEVGDAAVTAALAELAEEYAVLDQASLEAIEPTEDAIYAKKRAAESLRRLNSLA